MTSFQTICTSLYLFCVLSLVNHKLSFLMLKKSSIINDTTFVNLKDYSLDFVYDMKYATTDNFLKAKVYDCEACFDLKR
jgi:D-alanyl-D-alanine dipeptidase